MRDSKALKGFPYPRLRKNRDEEPGKLKRVLLKARDLFMFGVYYPIDSFISRYKERIGRSLAYARFGWLNYDFDSGFMFDLMEFKLKRILECLIDGHAVQEKENLDALREAIKIVARLHREDYDWKYHRAHDKKWGKIKSKHVPVEFDKKGEPTMYRWDTSRKGVKTKKQKEVERKEFLDCFARGEQDRLADLDRLNEIFKKHERTWWD